jgi:23S rRNA pseudouridine1911/1915/1917 synthase
MADQVEGAGRTFWIVPAGLQGIRLDAFARRCLPQLSRRQLENALRENTFTINGKIGKKGDRLGAGDRLVFTGPADWLAEKPVADTQLNVRIVYEDSSILVVDKPAGMATHGFSGKDSRTLANFLAAQRPAMLSVGKSRWEPGLVHRLDVETSGLVLVAKSQSAFDQLRTQFRRREISKIYWALVWGKTANQGVIELPLAHDRRDKRRMRVVRHASSHQDERRWRATTRYRKLGAARGITLLEVEMATGVTHQIRAHLAAIGHPIVGDALYGADHTETFGLQRHFLHARSLAFRHPDDGRVISVDADLPVELKEILRRAKIAF